MEEDSHLCGLGFRSLGFRVCRVKGLDLHLCVNLVPTNRSPTLRLVGLLVWGKVGLWGLGLGSLFYAGPRALGHLIIPMLHGLPKVPGVQNLS